MKRQLLHELVEDAADARPEAIAVIDGTRRMTYAELESSSARLAGLLSDLGVARGDRVGIYREKSIEAIVAVYAILKSGAAYVPLDPASPPDRIGFIAANCGLRVLVTGSAQAAAWTQVKAVAVALTHVVVLDEDAPVEAAPSGVTLHLKAAVDGAAPRARSAAAISLDLAYILYTSGSTGRPKGVALTHRSCLTFVDWAVDEFAVCADDRLSSHAPLHFDLSTFDLFAAARAGAALVLVPQQASLFPVQITRLIEAEEITIWYSVPSILAMVSERGKLAVGSLPSLRLLLFAGEVFPTKYLQRLVELVPHCRFVNLYGPTETNVCTWYDVPRDGGWPTDPIPIGRAIADVEVFAVDDDGGLAGVGEVGELWVRGLTVMQGYWDDPERTSTALASHPRGAAGDLAYRTGDMVELLPSGDYRFLGRRDSQVKSRGYRIELGDIEAALYAHPSVLECAVFAVPDELVSNRLRALVVVREAVPPDELVRFCSERVPRYMIPETIETVASLPKTSTGKVDRQALVQAMNNLEER